MSNFRTLNHHSTGLIWLSCEDYHNAGIKPERIKEIIESLQDPGSGNGATLRCEPQGINHNWNIRTMATSEITHGMMVQLPRDLLEEEIDKMKAQGNKEA